MESCAYVTVTTRELLHHLCRLSDLAASFLPFNLPTCFRLPLSMQTFTVIWKDKKDQEQREVNAKKGTILEVYDDGTKVLYNMDDTYIMDKTDGTKITFV